MSSNTAAADRRANARKSAPAMAAQSPARGNGPALADLKAYQAAGALTVTEAEHLAAVEGAMMGRRRAAREKAEAVADLSADLGLTEAAALADATAAALRILTEAGADPEAQAVRAEGYATQAVRRAYGVDRDHLTGAALARLAAQAVREALASGGRKAYVGLEAAARAEAAADLAQDLTAWGLERAAEAPAADLARLARKSGRAPGRAVLKYLAAAEARADREAARPGPVAEPGPRWDAAPATAADLADLGHGRTGYRAAWLSALKREAWRRLKAEARAGKARRLAQGTPEARADLLAAQARRRSATADREARRLAEALGLADRERAAVAAAIDGLTSRERAAVTGRTAAAERKAAERGRADLGKRWPDRATLSADLAAATREALTEAQAEALATVAGLAAAALSPGRAVAYYLAEADRGDRRRIGAAHLAAIRSAAALRPLGLSAATEALTWPEAPAWPTVRAGLAARANVARRKAAEAPARPLTGEAVRLPAVTVGPAERWAAEHLAARAAAADLTPRAAAVTEADTLGLTRTEARKADRLARRKATQAQAARTAAAARKARAMPQAAEALKAARAALALAEWSGNEVGRAQARMARAEAQAQAVGLAA